MPIEPTGPSEPRQLHLNAFLMAPGHHDAAWRHPASQPHRATDVTYFQQLAQIAERGKFDSIFFADGLALWGRQRLQRLRRPGAADAAAGDRRGHQPHRPDRHRLHHLSTSRSIWPASSPRWTTSAAAGPAGTSSPRWRGTRRRTSASTSTSSTPSATTRADGVRRGRHRAVGQLGRRRLPARQGSRASTPTPTRSARSTTRQALPGARPAQRPALAAGPAGAGPGRARPRPAGLRRAASPRPCSPRSRRWPTAQAFYARAQGAGRGVRPATRTSC